METKTINPGPFDIVVFASDENGKHENKEAAIAVELYGAKTGTSRGIAGRSYALPTYTNGKVRDRWKVIKSICSLLFEAQNNPNLRFIIPSFDNFPFEEELMKEMFTIAKASEIGVGSPLPYNLIMLKGLKHRNKDIYLLSAQSLNK